MKSTLVDPNSGDVVCPVCGARNQFTVKRTAKAKWTGVLTVGVGMAAMPKRLSCNGCGTNLKRGGGSASPAKRSPVTPKPATPKPVTPEPGSQPLPTQVKEPPAPTGDAAWDTLVANTKQLGLTETGGKDLRWLKRSHDRTTVARYSVSQARFDINLTNPAARERALALDGATEVGGVLGYIDVPRDHRREWEGLVALAVGRDPGELRLGAPQAGDSESPTSPLGVTSELERLAELHARGSLTDEEFQRAKARVLQAE